MATALPHTDNTDPCEHCDGEIEAPGYYIEFEYPPGCDEDLGYVSGYLCRECADALAVTVLAGLEADDT